jgi:hypothetical protein
VENGDLWSDNDLRTAFKTPSPARPTLDVRQMPRNDVGGTAGLIMKDTGAEERPNDT